jgi:hypothetical protein
MSRSISKQQETRLAAGYSLTAAAALANVAPATYRAFELDADAVTPAKRQTCATAVERMAEVARLKLAS